MRGPKADGGCSPKSRPLLTESTVNHTYKNAQYFREMTQSPLRCDILLASLGALFGTAPILETTVHFYSEQLRNWRSARSSAQFFARATRIALTCRSD